MLTVFVLTVDDMVYISLGWKMKAMNVERMSKDILLIKSIFILAWDIQTPEIGELQNDFFRCTLAKFHRVEQERSTHQVVADTPCYTLQTTSFEKARE